jgi:hypothetical protein
VKKKEVCIYDSARTTLSASMPSSKSSLRGARHVFLRRMREGCSEGSTRTYSRRAESVGELLLGFSPPPLMLLPPPLISVAHVCRRETCSAEHPPGKACVRSAAIQRCEGSGPARRGGDAYRNACRAWGGSAVLVRSRPGEKNSVSGVLGAIDRCKMPTPFFSGAFGSQDAPPCPLNPVLGPAPLPATPEGGPGQ